MSPETKNLFLDRYLTPVAVLLGAIIIAAALVFGGGPKGAATTPDVAAAPEVDVSKLTLTGPYIGSPDAPTTMALFYDYQCPFCQKFELEVMPELMDEVQAGKVRIVFKDFQFLGQYSEDPERDDSMTAAVFGRAVWEAHPDRFYDWFRAMAEKQDEENGGFGDTKSVEALTRTIPGIDGDRVVALVKEKGATYQTAVIADYEEGVAIGVQGTPSVVVGKKLLSGLSSEAYIVQLTAAID